MIPRSHLLWSGVLWAVLGCAADRPEVMEPPPVCPALTQMYVQPSSGAISVGDSARFIARIRLSCTGPDLDGPFEWSSTDSSVGRVNAGVVYGRAAGQVTIVARFVPKPYFAAGAQVTVTP